MAVRCVVCAVAGGARPTTAKTARESTMARRVIDMAAPDDMPVPYHAGVAASYRPA